MISRQSQFHTGILRTAPAGLDQVTAAAVRSGCLRVTPDGMIWLPLGSRLLDRLRELARGAPVGWGTLTGSSDLASSATLSLLKTEPRSYRELPLLVAADSMSRGDPAGSLKDAGSLGGLEWGAAAADVEQADTALDEIEQRLLGDLARCGLEPLFTNDGHGRRDWVLLGEDAPTICLLCSGCGVLSEADLAAFALTPSPHSPPEGLREVATPGANTIQMLCDQLGIQPSSTLKALFLTTAEGETLLALLRGDLDASPAKLRRELGTEQVRPARLEEIRPLGVAAGYAGPVGLAVRPTRSAPGVWVVADRSIVGASNLVTGANREGVHLAGVNFPRDFAVTEVVDFARAPRAAACAACGAALVEGKGRVLARRERYDGAFSFASPEGTQRRGSLVSLRLSLASTAAGVIKAALHPNGMRFPPACAPFRVHVIALPGGPDLATAMEALDSHAVDVLIDDRDVSAGVKFAEADWIGSPVRIISGRKSGEAGGVEIRLEGSQGRVVTLSAIVPTVLFALDEVM